MEDNRAGKAWGGGRGQGVVASGSKKDRKAGGGVEHQDGGSKTRQNAGRRQEAGKEDWCGGSRMGQEEGRMGGEAIGVQRLSKQGELRLLSSAQNPNH